MARYGRGYYTDLSSLIAGLQKGLSEALVPTGDIMVEGIKDIIKQRLYDVYEPSTYDRTYQVLNSVSFNKTGETEIEFYFDDNAITVSAQDSGWIAHKYLQDGWTTEGMITDVWANDGMHDDIAYEVKRYIRDEFPKIYRQCCKSLGISLE